MYANEASINQDFRLRQLCLNFKVSDVRKLHNCSHETPKGFADVCLYLRRVSAELISKGGCETSLFLHFLSIGLKFDRMKPVYFYVRGPYDQI